MYNNIVGASAIGINIESTAKGGILCTAHVYVVSALHFLDFYTHIVCCWH